MDRLKDLQRGNNFNRQTSDYEKVPTDQEQGLSDSSSGNDFMQDFFGDVELVKGNIAIIKAATGKIAEIEQNVLQATTNDNEQDYSNELEPLIKATNVKASITKQLLQRLREDTEKMRKAKGTEKDGKSNANEIRIRENLANTLTRKFVDVMKDYQNAQSKYRNGIKKKVKRQVTIVKPDATAEEVDAVFKAGGGAGQVLKSAILSGEASDSIQNAYMNVADKLQDVLTLEASMAELHQMFLDFALLTEQQGELLDRIEHQVKDAEDYVEQANVELTEAITLQKSIRYKQCIIALIILVILGIIVGLVAARVSGGLG